MPEDDGEATTETIWGSFGIMDEMGIIIFLLYLIFFDLIHYIWQYPWIGRQQEERWLLEELRLEEFTDANFEYPPEYSEFLRMSIAEDLLYMTSNIISEPISEDEDGDEDESYGPQQEWEVDDSEDSEDSEDSDSEGSDSEDSSSDTVIYPPEEKPIECSWPFPLLTI
ncbi:hypothetical protein GQX73_g5805 [Xylaria multiplex]|uniref:Uncharacterized protein n=1 Tax=Xylaria multiplex TaxID=323545 RepID=A0A7C8J033_9PEZI|nr:hypothetical protein GQX73_g5805 [Xylaria multiplex]